MKSELHCRCLVVASRSVMATSEDDLALLLSLQDRVLETPPGSPTTRRRRSPDNIPRNGWRGLVAMADMSVFRDTVRDYLEDSPTVSDVGPKVVKKSKGRSNGVHVEKFSGLRIRDLIISSVDLSNCFSDSRFIRLNSIRNALIGDTISGCWATVGVLIEKGEARLSSAGKKYCIWKVGCLGQVSISVFLFGDAYSKNMGEQAGTVFALFNSGVRKDATGNGFSLSVFSASQVLKMGTSVDYGVCKGQRTDGNTCTMVINKREGAYCKYHKSKASQNYTNVRSELKGGNLRTVFRDPLQSEGIYMVDPLRDKTNQQKATQPIKVLSVDGLKKALSKAGKVTTNTHSQGIRFLAEVTGRTTCQKDSNKRLFSAMKTDATLVHKKQPVAKRKKPEKETEKMIELEVFSSDGE